MTELNVTNRLYKSVSSPPRPQNKFECSFTFLYCARVKVVTPPKKLSANNLWKKIRWAVCYQFYHYPHRRLNVVDSLLDNHTYFDRPLGLCQHHEIFNNPTAVLSWLRENQHSLMHLYWIENRDLDFSVELVCAFRVLHHGTIQSATRSLAVQLVGL